MSRSTTRTLHDRRVEKDTKEQLRGLVSDSDTPDDVYDPKDPEVAYFRVWASGYLHYNPDASFEDVRRTSSYCHPIWSTLSSAVKKRIFREQKDALPTLTCRSVTFT